MHAVEGKHGAYREGPYDDQQRKADGRRALDVIVCGCVHAGVMQDRRRRWAILRVRGVRLFSSRLAAPTVQGTRPWRKPWATRGAVVRKQQLGGDVAILTVGNGKPAIWHLNGQKLCRVTMSILRARVGFQVHATQDALVAHAHLQSFATEASQAATLCSGVETGEQQGKKSALEVHPMGSRRSCVDQRFRDQRWFQRAARESRAKRRRRLKSRRRRRRRRFVADLREHPVRCSRDIGSLAWPGTTRYAGHHCVLGVRFIVICEVSPASGEVTD